VPVPVPWLERVRSASARADQLIMRCEAQRRAQGAYDRAQVAQGVRLVFTGLALIVLLVALKLWL
jgi:hypothetical protein